MKHFFRTQLTPVEVLEVADRFFPTLPLERTANTARTRTFTGDLGALNLSVKKEGGHYTFVEIHTDQMGESLQLQRDQDQQSCRDLRNAQQT